MNRKKWYSLLSILCCLMNVSAQEASNLKRFPTQISLFHPFGTHGRQSIYHSYNLSINFFTGKVGGVKGLEISGLWSNIKGDVVGIQISGLSNDKIVNMRGIQAAGLGNGAVDTKGIQIGGFTNFSDKVKGMQLGGFANGAVDTKGIQIVGFVNFSDKVKGMQLGGFANVSDTVRGVQLSGLINGSYDVKGIQTCIMFNSVRTMDGLQIGLVNKSENLRGVQIGLWNVSRKRKLPLINWNFKQIGTQKAHLKKNVSENMSSEEVNEKPTFNGGDAEVEFLKFINSNIVYPEKAQMRGIKGRVIVAFTIDVDGSLIDVKLVRKSHRLLNTEALRVVNLSPKWTPGIQKDKPVKVKYQFPINFNL